MRLSAGQYHLRCRTDSNKYEQRNLENIWCSLAFVDLSISNLFWCHSNITLQANKQNPNAITDFDFFDDADEIPKGIGSCGEDIGS